MALISFEKVVEHDNHFTVIDPTGREYHGLWSDIRVDRKTLPDGWYAYDIRHDDDGTGEFATIEENYICVNHMGTFCTQEKIDLPNGEDGTKWANFGGNREAGEFDYAFN